MQTTFKKADLLIAALLLCVALLFFSLPLLFSGHAPSTLVVTHADGQEQRYALDEDLTLTLTGNGHTLVVSIAQAGVRVTESSCPDGVCRAHTISHAGETLVCAPAGIALTISGQGGETDAVIG